MLKEQYSRQGHNETNCKRGERRESSMIPEFIMSNV
jgi:hypothetical protein